GPVLVKIGERRPLARAACTETAPADVGAAPPDAGKIGMSVRHARDAIGRALLGDGGPGRDQCRDERDRDVAPAPFVRANHPRSSVDGLEYGAHRAREPSCGPNIPYFVPSAVISSRSMPAFFDSS